MLGLTPAIQAELKDSYDASPAVASFWASMAGGIAGGVLSHPFDVIKTCSTLSPSINTLPLTSTLDSHQMTSTCLAVQGDLERKSYGGAFGTASSLVGAGGFPRLLHGVFWRTVNITATVYIANECCCRLPPYVMRVFRGEGYSANV